MAEEHKITEAQAAAAAKKYAGKVSGETVTEMLDKEDGVKGFFKNVEALKKYWEDICLIFPLLKDWVSGKYTKIPWAVIASLVGAILYVISPLDMIPDFIPIAGFLDDAAVFGVAISFAKDYLDEYRAWKNAHGGDDK